MSKAERQHWHGCRAFKETELGEARDAAGREGVVREAASRMLRTGEDLHSTRVVRRTQ